MRILLVDDEPTFRQSIARLLRTDLEVEDVAEASCGRAALEKFRQFRPDLTLMDIFFRNDPDGLDGEDVIRTILSEFPDARIIAVSQYYGVERVRFTLDAGAQSYIPKGLGLKPLFDVVRSCMQGDDPLIPPQLLTRARAVPKENWLTRKQYDVLRLLDKGLTQREVGDVLGIKETGVKARVQAAYEKTHTNRPYDAINYALLGREPL